MSIDNLDALRARDDLLTIVHRWPELTARLEGVGGNALTGLPGHVMMSGPVIIDVGVSDLMRDIEERVARFYGRILLDEVDPTHGCHGRCHGSPEHQCIRVPFAPCTSTRTVAATDCPARRDPITTSTMPGLLADVAARYGHFTNDPDLAQGFCDDAHDYRHKVETTLAPPGPATYLGPCPTTDCGGEIYAKDGHHEGRCPECHEPWTLTSQRAWLKAELSDRLMTPSEIARALKMLDLETKEQTVFKWVQRGRLEEVTDGLYRLADAMTLAQATRTRRTA